MNDAELTQRINAAMETYRQIRRLHEEAEQLYLKTVMDLLMLRTTSRVEIVDGRELRVVPLTPGRED